MEEFSEKLERKTSGSARERHHLDQQSFLVGMAEKGRRVR